MIFILNFVYCLDYFCLFSSFGLLLPEAVTESRATTIEIYKENLCQAKYHIFITFLKIITPT